ncbi:hypothetical protein H4S02_004127 [Coemansia sp. RSA 2611]|nr:hypothetical protein H4S02_004127 [Coemansia sp. RSA 2611]
MASPETYDIHELKVDPEPVLSKCTERVACETCGKSVKYFCYYCYRAVGELEGKVPQIRLPFKLDVVKHAKELDGKSTAIHAKVVAPEDVEIITYSDACLDGVDVERTALLYPGPDAQDVGTMDMSRVERVVVIDGTWSQARAMVRDSAQLQRMQKVTIRPRRTRFWRYQNMDEQYLATIEAIYFLYRDSAGSGYDGEYDALMYFFKYFYTYIQGEYAARPERRFHSRHQANYIDYSAAQGGAERAARQRDDRTRVNYDFGDLELERVFGDGD